MISLNIAVVVWKDAHGDGATWQPYDATDPDPCLVTSVGYLLPKNHGGKPGHITVAQSTIRDEYVDSLLHIPRRMVVRKQIIGRVNVDGNETRVE